MQHATPYSTVPCIHCSSVPAVQSLSKCHPRPTFPGQVVTGEVTGREKVTSVSTAAEWEGDIPCCRQYTVVVTTRPQSAGHSTMFVDLEVRGHLTRSRPLTVPLKGGGQSEVTNVVDITVSDVGRLQDLRLRQRGSRQATFKVTSLDVMSFSDGQLATWRCPPGGCLGKLPAGDVSLRVEEVPTAVPLTLPRVVTTTTTTTTTPKPTTTKTTTTTTTTTTPKTTTTTTTTTTPKPTTTTRTTPKPTTTSTTTPKPTSTPKPTTTATTTTTPKPTTTTTPKPTTTTTTTTTPKPTTTGTKSTSKPTTTTTTPKSTTTTTTTTPKPTITTTTTTPKPTTTGTKTTSKPTTTTTTPKSTTTTTTTPKPTTTTTTTAAPKPTMSTTSTAKATTRTMSTTSRPPSSPSPQPPFILPTFLPPVVTSPHSNEVTAPAPTRRADTPVPPPTDNDNTNTQLENLTTVVKNPDSESDEFEMGNIENVLVAIGSVVAILLVLLMACCLLGSVRNNASDREGHAGSESEKDKESQVDLPPPPPPPPAVKDASGKTVLGPPGWRLEPDGSDLVIHLIKKEEYLREKTSPGPPSPLDDKWKLGYHDSPNYEPSTSVDLPPKPDIPTQIRDRVADADSRGTSRVSDAYSNRSSGPYATLLPPGESPLSLPQRLGIAVVTPKGDESKGDAGVVSNKDNPEIYATMDFDSDDSEGNGNNGAPEEVKRDSFGYAVVAKNGKKNGGRQDSGDAESDSGEFVI